MATPPIDADVIERFWAKVATGDGCWEWQGARRPFGYGQMQIGRRPWPAHRISYAIANGAIPDGLLVRHRCDNPPCVRPDHLEVGTWKDNFRDAMERGRRDYHPERWVSLSSVADATGIPRSTLRQWIRRGKLTVLKSAELYIRRSEVERYRTENKRA